MERQTRQRIAMHRVLGEAPRPMSAAELLNATRSAVTSIGIATIYRHLRTMVRRGQVVTVKLPGDRVRYEAAGKEHHHHFVCGTCGRVFEVPGCAPGLWGVAPVGFSVDRHEVILYGRCSECVPEPHVARGGRLSARTRGEKHDVAGHTIDEGVK
jgi:Fur family ferric uptake transcriptional regulator